ncbi:MAG: hypothetical protein ACKOUS_11430, partial [Alphaproteobacteria bacterium]
MIASPAGRLVLGTLRYAAMVAVAAVLLLPIWWILVSAIRPGGEIFRYATDVGWRTLVPERLTLEHFRTMLASDMPRAISNSIIVSLVTVVVGTMVNAAAGSAFAVFAFPLKRTL